MDSWCSCGFIQSSSLGDSEPCETLQARRQKGGCSLFWEASPHFCISLSEIHESCLPRWRAPRHHLSSPLLLHRLCREHCYVLLADWGSLIDRIHRTTEDQASAWPAALSCSNTAGEFFIHNQINQKVVRFELAFVNTIDCVDLVI